MIDQIGRNGNAGSDDAVTQAGPVVGAASRGQLFRSYLAATLPVIYDFALRLLRSQGMAEQAIETGLRSILRSPARSMESQAQFLTRLCAEVYLVAEATRDIAGADDESLRRLAAGAPAALPPDAGRLIFEAAAALPLHEYAALHLRERTGFARESVAEGMGLTPAYAYVLLGRARRHFEEAVNLALLLRQQPGACAELEALRAQHAEAATTPALPGLVVQHVAAGCQTCRGSLSRFGDVAGWLPYLASVEPPADLYARLDNRLGERIAAFEEVEPEAAVTVGAATALAGASTGAEPGLKQSRFARFGQWWDEHNLTRVALIVSAGLIVLVVAIAIAIFRPEPRTPAVVNEVLGIQRENGAENQDSIIGRASTPTTGRLPEVVFTAPAEPAAVQQGEGGQATPDAPEPRLTATPQNRVTPPVVILNPVPAGQPASNVRTSPQPTSEATEAPATATATPLPTPPPPRLAVSSQSLSFAANESTKTITLSNAGTGEVRWTAVPQQVWIIVSPGAGTVQNTSVGLQVYVDHKLRAPGRQTGTISLSSNAGTFTITVLAE